MKIMKKFLSMAALALVGTVMTGCSGDDNLANNQQPVKQDNIVTVTTTVGLGSDDATRALDINYTTKKLTKTFSVGDKVGLAYYNTTDYYKVKAVSNPLEAGDITDDGKSAKLTFTLVNPKADTDVGYCYPFDMMDERGNNVYSKLNSQDGTLDNVAEMDLASGGFRMTGTALPSAILWNHIAIMAFTLKDATGDNDITSTITGMTIVSEYGDPSYTITRSAAPGPIYVAMKMIMDEDEDFLITATDGTKIYTKTLSGRIYRPGNFYQLTLKMPEVPDGAINGKFSVSATKQVYFSKGNLQLTGENAWQFANNQWEYFGDSQSDNHRDLFGWGTGNTPNLVSTNNDDYGTFTDWGSNSDLQSALGTGWETLSSAEWRYVFQTRVDADGKYGYATVAGIAGVVILPDVFFDPMKNNGSGYFISSSYNTGWENNVYSADDWTAMEYAGAVFLPAAGGRSGSSVDNVGSSGYYWSSTASDSSDASVVGIHSYNVNPADGATKQHGFSVRLVRPVQ